MSLRHNIAKERQRVTISSCFICQIRWNDLLQDKTQDEASTSFENLGKMVPEKKQIENEYHSTFSGILEEANF